MQKMSDEFNDIVENGNALYHITITRVRDNRILGLPIDSFKYIGVKCADDNITFGNAPCQSVTFSIHNPEINLENEELFIQQGLYLEDGTLENIDLGYFTVQKPISDGEVTQYVCYDRMVKFEKIFYIPGDYPTTYTVNGILYEIEHATGIKINPFPSSADYRLAKAMFNGIYTMREMLGYLAGIIGKDAIVNRAGEVEFKWYTSVDGYTLDGSRIYQGSTNIETEYDMYIEKIVCSAQTYGETPRELTVGTGNRIVYVSNPFMQSFMLTAIYERIKNFRYRGITAEFLGDFRLDLGDVINVTKGDETYQCCVMEISHQSDGGVRTTISSHNKTEREQEFNVTGSVTRSIDRTSNTLAGVEETVNKHETEINELFTSVSNGKKLIASAITDKGVETDANDKFATMAENIGKIESGGGCISVPIDLNQYADTYTYISEVVGSMYRYLKLSSNGSTANTSNHYVEVQAFDDNGVNVALGKTSNVATDGAYNNSSAYIDLGVGNQTLTIDLGSIYKLDYIKVWHYYGDGRTYHDVVVSASIDGVDYDVLFNSNVDGEYAETPNGKTIYIN